MPIRLLIPQKTLENLYLSRKMSSFQIAVHLGCGQSTVMKYLRAHSIPLRSIQEAKALTPPKYPRRDFSGDKKEMAYMIGFRIGDLHISKSHPNSPTIRVSCNTTKIEQLRLVRKLFSPYGHVVEYPKDKNGAISIRCFVNNSFDFLLNKEDLVASWISENKKLLISFIAGYIDAEGCFSITGRDGIFCIRTQDKGILHVVYSGFINMGILCKPPALSRKAGTVDYKGIRSNKDVWLLTVYRKASLLKLATLLRPLLKHHNRRNDMFKVERSVRRRNELYGNMKDRRWLITYKK